VSNSSSSIVSLTPANTPQEHAYVACNHQPPLTTAQDNCKKMRIKCVDKENPPCKRCKLRKLECTFDRSFVDEDKAATPAPRKRSRAGVSPDDETGGCWFGRIANPPATAASRPRSRR
jgi:hypothetical protein